eukprot:2210246-Pleurochrysis_carterae.AAC.1
MRHHRHAMTTRRSRRRAMTTTMVQLRTASCDADAKPPPSSRPTCSQNRPHLSSSTCAAEPSAKET